MSKLTPFEQAVCVWILQLPGTWSDITWDDLSAVHEKAFVRLVKGGFIEARLPVVLKPKGKKPIRTIWRVTGVYSPVLEEQVNQYVKVHGLKAAGVIIEDYSAGRLTADGLLAKRDFLGDHDLGDEGETRPGLPKGYFDLVAGGPDGQGGVLPPGVVRLETEREDSHGSAEAHSTGAKVASAQAHAHAVANVDTAPLAQGLKAIAAALRTRQESPAPSAADSKASTAKEPAKSTTRAASPRSMTQDQVDQAVASYQAGRAGTYTDLRAGVRANKPGAMRAARKLFGRNAVARAIGCKARAMVSKSPVYQRIQDELKLGGRQRGKPARAGLEAVVNKAAQETGDTTVNEVIANETRQLVLTHLDPDEAKQALHKLEMGEMTDAQARMLVDLRKDQRRDDNARRVPSDP